MSQDRTAPLNARIAEIDARIAGSAPAGETEAAELLLERAEVLALLDRVDDAIETLQRLMARATPDGAAAVRIASARALRIWIELNESNASAGDALVNVQRIDAALAALPAESTPASRTAAGDLLVEKALLLDRAGEAAEVERVLDDLISEFGDSDDPDVAKSAAWALRNRIEHLLAEDSHDQAIAASAELAALYGRVARKPIPGQLTEQLVAVWKLLTKNGFGEEANRLIPNVDRSLAEADRQLASGRAQAFVGMLLAAYRTGDQRGAENAITGLHSLGEPVLDEIDAAVAQRTAAAAILLLQKVPVLVDLDRTAEARETLDQVEQLLVNTPSPELQDIVLALRAELDGEAHAPDESPNA